MPRFSIITVCWNAKATLPRAIASVCAQTNRDFEYLLVDGGSTDGTVELIKQSSDVVTRFVSERDRGISDAFNKGVAMATGEFVALLNADDWYEPGALESVAREADRHPADVYCGLLRYWDGKTPGALFEVRPELLTESMSVNHIATFARRELFTKHGDFKLDYRAAMDYELLLRFYLRGARFHRVGEVLANMSLGGTSDVKWRLALAELRRAQLENGLGAVHANAHYLFQLGKGAARRVLQRSGIGAQVVDLYRKRLARVRRSA